MPESDRGAWLSRAIDDLIHGEVSSPPPPGFEDEELNSLLQVARARLNASQSSAQAGIQYEGAIWRQIVSRLDRYHPSGADASSPTPADQPASDVQELRDIIDLRRRMASGVAELAENHRESVWRNVQSRIAGGREKKTFSFVPFRHRDRREDAPAQGTRRSPRVAALAAGLAAIALALGPLPATGLAHHPAAKVAGFIGEFIGVTETEKAPPSMASSPLTVRGVTITSQQAADILNLPIREPAALPDGLAKTSSLFFSQPLTSDQPGLFVITYALVGGASMLSIYQEAASGADLAVPEGLANEIILAAGEPATYFEGVWQPGAGKFAWDANDAQTLVFELDGVRTIIRYTGPHMDPSALTGVADSMR